MVIIFVSLILVGILFFINSLGFNKTFIIKQGNHYCSNIFYKFYFLFKPRVFKFKVNFNSDFRYDINEEQEDINKLIGIGFLPGHHVESIRFGWRYNLRKGKMEILAYSYVNKNRIVPIDVNGKEEILFYCLMNNNYILNLEITKTEYKLFIKHELDTATGPISIIKRTKNKRFGYLLKPYFGGNKTAPKDFKIKIESIKNR